MYGLRYCSVINDYLDAAKAEMICKIQWPEIKRDEREQADDVKEG
jgi:hypothetical protein